jgi:hypothetical protein
MLLNMPLPTRSLGLTISLSNNGFGVTSLLNSSKIFKFFSWFYSNWIRLVINYNEMCTFGFGFSGTGLTALWADDAVVRWLVTVRFCFCLLLIWVFWDLRMVAWLLFIFDVFLLYGIKSLASYNLNVIVWFIDLFINSKSFQFKVLAVNFFIQI